MEEKEKKKRKVYMTDEEILGLIDKFKEIIGQELKYSELCKLSGLKPKTSDSKIRQLRELQLIANITKLDNPTRYRVDEVYDKMLLPVSGSQRFQAQMEVLILKMFQTVGEKTLYIPNGRLLQNLFLVNENYNFIKKKDNRDVLHKALDYNYEKLFEASNKAGQILYLWVDRALRRMEAKGLLLYRKGFCVVRRLNDSYVRVENVEMNSEMEKRILKCYHETYCQLGFAPSKEDEAFPWIPNVYQEMFHNVFATKIKAEFKDQMIINAFRANIITIGKNIVDRALESAKKELNEKAVDMIKSTRQLNEYTGYEREKLILEIIKVPPSIIYKPIVEKQKEQDKLEDEIEEETEEQDTEKTGKQNKHRLLR